MLPRKNSLLIPYIYSASKLELTLSTASCFVRHCWNIDVTAKDTFFSPLFYLYWNHKLSYIYISFIEVFFFLASSAVLTLINNTCLKTLLLKLKHINPYIFAKNIFIFWFTLSMYRVKRQKSFGRIFTSDLLRDSNLFFQ